MSSLAQPAAQPRKAPPSARPPRSPSPSFPPSPASAPPPPRQTASPSPSAKPTCKPSSARRAASTPPPSKRRVCSASRAPGAPGSSPSSRWRSPCCSWCSCSRESRTRSKLFRRLPRRPHRVRAPRRVSARPCPRFRPSRLWPSRSRRVLCPMQPVASLRGTDRHRRPRPSPERALKLRRQLRQTSRARRRQPPLHQHPRAISSSTWTRSDERRTTVVSSLPPMAVRRCRVRGARPTCCCGRSARGRSRAAHG